jgi:hypothetical protein
VRAGETINVPANASPSFATPPQSRRDCCASARRPVRKSYSRRCLKIRSPARIEGIRTSPTLPIRSEFAGTTIWSVKRIRAIRACATLPKAHSTARQHLAFFVRRRGFGSMRRRYSERCGMRRRWSRIDRFCCSRCRRTAARTTPTEKTATATMPARSHMRRS